MFAKRRLKLSLIHNRMRPSSVRVSSIMRHAPIAGAEISRTTTLLGHVAIEDAASTKVAIAIVKIDARHGESAMSLLGRILGHPIQKLLSFFVEFQNGHDRFET